MDAFRRSKPGPGVKTATVGLVAAGSVWETRMKNDEVKGGIKVFNGDDPDTNTGSRVGGGQEVEGESESVSVNGSPVPKGVKRNGSRKTWKPEPVKEVKSPVPAKKLMERKSPVQGIRKLRSDVAAKNKNANTDNSPELRKVKSDSCDKVMDHQSDKGIDAISLRKVKSQPAESFSSPSSVTADHREPGSVDEHDNNVDGTNSKELGMCAEGKDKEVQINSGQEIKSNTEVDQIVNKPSNDEDEADGEFSEYELEDEDEEEEEEENLDEEIEVEIEKKSLEVKEIGVTEEEPIISSTVSESERKPKPISPDLSKQTQSVEKPKPIIASSPKKQTPPPSPQIKRTVTPRIQRTTSISSSPHAKPTSSNVQKQAPPVSRQSSTVRQNYSKCSSYAYESFPETQNKLQNLVDLVMWRDVSKSAFVFGIGAFTIISSSYTRDLNISFISVISYLGLVYLAAIFLYRSIICRGYVDTQCTSNVLGEEEAIWLLRLVLPYLNEFLLKIKALFSGDPATTMKLAVLLFVLARCGSSITIWKMAKLGFFGVFTVPKVCSAYSSQFTAYGKFWIRRFKDAWDSCSHKKAVAFAIFTLVWNLSSVVARIWAVFMLFVAMRYYQQSLVSNEWEEDEKGVEHTWNNGSRREQGHITVESSKERKAS